MTIAIGIDAGRVKLAGGRVDIDDGRIGDRRVMDTRPSRGADVVLRDVVGLARGLGRDAIGIGIAVPEDVDEKGRISSATHWDWRDLDVPEEFEGLAAVRFMPRVFAGARGEARLGAGAETERFLYVDADIDLDAALVDDGRPQLDAAAALRAEALTSVASGAAIAAATGEPSARHAIAREAHRAIVADAAAALGAAAAATARDTGATRIVLGGSLGLDETFGALAIAAIAAADGPDAVPAGLGENAVIIGAALAAAYA